MGIKYPAAIGEEAEQPWISEAQVAEIEYTAFTSRPKGQNATARLIVRRVTRLNPKSVGRIFIGQVLRDAIARSQRTQVAHSQALQL